MKLSNISRSISNKISRNISHKIYEAPVSSFRNTEPSIQIHFYADSINGSDSNPGTTSNLAFQTLSALQTAILARGDGTNVSLARGSYWEEFLDIDSVSNTSIYVHGTGDPPVISGAMVIPSGSFTLSAHGSAAGVCYEYSWTRGSGDTGGQDWVMVWEGDYEQSESGGIGGTTPSQNRLTRRTSVALCAANPGSYYAVDGNNPSSLIYIHPYGSTNPISDGKVYYITRYSAGVDNYNPGETTGTVEGIHCRRSWGHYGPLQWGPGGTMRKILANGGGLHHSVHACVDASDIIMMDHPKLYGQASVPYTAYIPDGISLTHTGERVFVVGDDKTNQNISAFLSHGSTNPFTTVNLTQIAGVDIAGGASADANAFNVKGAFFDNCTTVCVYIAARQTATAEYCVIKDLTTFGISDVGPVDTTVRNRIVRNCVIRGGASSTPINVTPRNGSLTVENCLIILDGSVAAYSTVGVAATALDVVFRNNIIVFTGAPTLAAMIHFSPGTGTLLSNNNVFAYPGGANAFTLRWRLGATAVQSIANWRSTSGQDANSLAVFGTTAATFLNALFLNGSAGIAAGDYRINPSSGYTLVDGTNVNTCGPQYHWDWNARAVASGPPQAFPIIPETIADAKTYIADPEAWDFYA